MWINKIRERVNISLYNSKNAVLTIVRWCYFVVALSMIGVLIYYYGFPQTPESRELLTSLIKFSLFFYTIRYLIKIIYDFHPLRYIREHWIETIIIFYLIVEGVSYNFYDSFVIEKLFVSIGFKNFTEFSNLMIQLFFATYLFVDVFKKQDLRLHYKIHPGLLFMISIGGIILIGTGLLLLPEMTQPGYNLSFIDSLFISTSAASCTGLSTVDMSSILTFKGQIVSLLLIQVGALNTIAFGALYLLIAKLGIGLKQHKILEDYVNESSFLKTERMFFRIIKWVLIIELIGFICIFSLMQAEGVFENTSTRLFHALYHSISSFCNAGISMIPQGMLNPLIVENYTLHAITLALFFIGGLGMIYLFDLFGIKHLRQRMKYPWKSLRFDTKATFYTTLFLFALGAFVYYIFEYDRSLQGKSGFGAIITALHNGMAPRATGHLTVDFSLLSLPVIILFLFLMFIGASSGSSGGGIRVSTFAVLLSSVSSTIKRRPNVEMFKRTIDNELVLRAYSILIFFIVANLAGIFALSITEQASIETGEFQFLDIVFEHVSAFCTSGLSSGITSNLSVPGKSIIIAAMFVGRVGTLTVAYLFGKQIVSVYKYPKGHLMIG